MRTTPTWLVEGPAEEIDLGVLRSGKEAQINLVERIDERSGRRCVIARKRYLPRSVSSKGQLEAAGLQRASAFRNDVEYREGRQFRKTRDRRAVETMSAYGRKLLQDRWLGHEHDVMSTLWQLGAPVPYPIGFAEDTFDLEYVGDARGAAPQLARARLDASALDEAWRQLVDGLATITAAGYAHGDLSAYNLLWWQERLWFIDFPQAVDVAANPQGLSFLHRDVANVCAWFASRGVDADVDAVFAELVGSAFPAR